MKYEDLIDQQLLEKLEKLTLSSNRSFIGLVGGQRAVRYSGTGQEFLDHRLFHQGDDLRAVNWRAYLRLEKLYLKTFALEPHVPARLLLDQSLSMTTGTPSKFDYARRLAAALTYIAMVHLDTVVLIPFHETIEPPLTCSGGRQKFLPAVQYLCTLQANGKTDFQRVCRTFLERFERAGLCIVISDFLSDSDCLESLQALADHGHELLLIHLWAEEDRNPPWLGDLEVEDLETGRVMRITVNEGTQAAYERAFTEYAETLRRLAEKNAGRYIGLSTGTPLEDALFGAICLQLQ